MEENTNLLGAFLKRAYLMNSKYEFSFTSEAQLDNFNRLTNQIWKLLPMRENNENWKKQLSVVIIEIAGLGEIFSHNPILLQLLSKLEGLNIIDTSFEVFRRTIFESISLVQEVKNNE